MPAVEGESREDAEKALTDAGFKVKVEEAFSDDVPSGDVISSSPQAGTQATKGRTVTITVSQGSEGIAVPKVVGLQRDDAEAQLEAAGLKAEVTEEETTQPPGTVMKQDPRDGDPRRPRRDRRAHRRQGSARGAGRDGFAGGGGDVDAGAGRLQGPDPRSRGPDAGGRRRRPGPGSGHGALERGHGHDLRRHRRDRGHADPDADPRAVKVAVLAGGRSSEHDVSLNSAAAVRAGVARRGP